MCSILKDHRESHIISEEDITEIVYIKKASYRFPFLLSAHWGKKIPNILPLKGQLFHHELIYNCTESIRSNAVIL